LLIESFENSPAGPAADEFADVDDDIIPHRRPQSRIANGFDEGGKLAVSGRGRGPLDTGCRSNSTAMRCPPSTDQDSKPSSHHKALANTARCHRITTVRVFNANEWRWPHRCDRGPLTALFESKL
jgi:hypothetical protein